MNSLPDLISALPILWQYIIAVLITIGALWALWDKTIGRIGRWLMYELWPNRQKWTAICLPLERKEPHYGAPETDANRPIHKPGMRWCQMRQMEIDDYYQLDIQKIRVISRIQLLTYAERYPKRFQLKVFSGKDDTPLFEKEYNGPIDIDFVPPVRGRVFLFTITEPMRGVQSKDGRYPSWCIYDVRLTEVRLFGRWWRKMIR